MCQLAAKSLGDAHWTESYGDSMYSPHPVICSGSFSGINYVVHDDYSKRTGIEICSAFQGR